MVEKQPTGFRIDAGSAGKPAEELRTTPPPPTTLAMSSGFLHLILSLQLLTHSSVSLFLTHTHTFFLPLPAACFHPSRMEGRAGECGGAGPAADALPLINKSFIHGQEMHLRPRSCSSSQTQEMGAWPPANPAISGVCPEPIKRGLVS